MKLPFKEPAYKIELHYYFTDQSHSMHAHIRNKCEAYLLGILKEISNVLNARLLIETEAFAEGGLRERFVLRGKSDLLRSFAAAMFHYVLPLEVDIEKTVNDEDRQTTKQNIDTLRRELKNLERYSDQKADLETALHIFGNNLKIIKLKSNFYRQLSACEKVTKFSVQLVNAKNELSGKAATVNRKQFNTYMLVADTLKPEKDKKAVIEIVSPVLRPGNYKWKGIYQSTGKIISFRLQDEDFKNEVISQGMAFKNGTLIECVLESSRKMSELGEIVVTGYSVLSVERKLDGEMVTETPRPKPVKKKPEPVIQQLDLFGF